LMKEFFELVECVKSNDRTRQHFGIIGLRKLLSKDNEPPIVNTIENGLIPVFIQFIKNESESYLQLEAVWCLTNMLAGTTEQTQAVLQLVPLENFTKLIYSPKVELAELGLWAIGNIAGDSAPLRDLLLQNNCFEILIQLIENTQLPEIIDLGVWALANLCKSHLNAPLELIFRAINIFCKIVLTSTEPEVITDAIWGLNLLSHGENNVLQVQKILESGILAALVLLLDNQRLATLVPVIRIIGNIAASDETNAEILSQVPRLIPMLFKCVGHQKKVVRREACWTLSNLAAGSQQQIGQIIEEVAYLSKLISMAIAEPIDVKREALWVLVNATNRCGMDQIIHMMHNGILDCFLGLLSLDEDPEIIKVAITGINNVLNKGVLIARQTQGENIFLSEFEQHGGVLKMEKMQEHPSEEVYEAALKLLEKHYDLVDN